MIRFLSIVLKALLMSTLNTTKSLWFQCFSIVCRSRWVTFSVPPGHATPNCRGVKNAAAFDFRVMQAHLLVRRRNISPEAMGLISLPVLFNAVSDAPAMNGAIDWGAAPRNKMFTTCRSCVVSEIGTVASWASNMCWTLSPEGPHAVSYGKLWIALAMSKLESNWRASVSSLMAVVIFSYKS